MIKIWFLPIANYNLVKRIGPYSSVVTLDNADSMIILQVVLRGKLTPKNKKATTTFCKSIPTTRE